MTPAVVASPASEPIPECRARIILLSLLAGFAANVIGAVFAVNTTLFASDPQIAATMDNYQPWFFIVPFGWAAALYIYYVRPLYLPSATLTTYRVKILGFPLFFVLNTTIAWTMGFVQSIVLPWMLSPQIQLWSLLLSNMGILGISFLSSAVGYFLFEYLNRTYWIPRLFNNKLDSHKDRFQPSISAKFYIYYLGVSAAPILFLGWILIWADSQHHFLTSEQTLYITVFLILTGVAGLKITQIFARLFQSPLVEARKATDRIASGDYGIELTVRSSDELGILGERINDMASRLRANASHIRLLNEEIEKTQKEVVFTMGAIGETRSKETGNHVRRVAEYSSLLARAYGLSAEQAELLKQASPMHDIGKVAISDSILNKPGRLTVEEFEIMKTHSRIGHDMLCHSQRELLQTAAVVALQHHEKYDGSGYPSGLAGEQIHIYARITAVADVFDALGSERSYKPAWKDGDIFTLFRQQSGRHFDPRIVDLFFANLDAIRALRDEFADPVVH